MMLKTAQPYLHSSGQNTETSPLAITVLAPRA